MFGREPAVRLAAGEGRKRVDRAADTKATGRWWTGAQGRHLGASLIDQPIDWRVGTNRRGATSCGKGGLRDGRTVVEVVVEPCATTCASRKVRAGFGGALALPSVSRPRGRMVRDGSQTRERR